MEFISLKAATRDTWAKALRKKIYKLATSVTFPSSKGFVGSQPRSYIQ